MQCRRRANKWQNMIFNFAKAREKCAQHRLKAQEEKCRSQRAAWGVWREWNDFGDRRRLVSWLFARANRTVRGSRVTAGQLEPTAQSYANTGCTFVVEVFAVLQ